MTDSVPGFPDFHIASDEKGLNVPMSGGRIVPAWFLEIHPVLVWS